MHLYGCAGHAGCCWIICDYQVMITRLRPELSIDSHESAVFNIGGEKYIVTVRRGVAEVTRDKPLYGTPEPIGEWVEPFRPSSPPTPPTKCLSYGPCSILCASHSPFDYSHALSFPWRVVVFFCCCLKNQALSRRTPIHSEGSCSN